MSWRLAPLTLLVAVACASGNMKVKKGEPQTAREKMLAEEKAKQDKDTSDDAHPPGSKKWSGWRYQGDRKQCFFTVGRKCFKTENAACQAAKCKAPSRCEADGGGPAIMRCVGGPEKADDDAEQTTKSK